MITAKDFIKERDEKIYEAAKTKRHKVIAFEYGLSPSRVKAICVEQRKKKNKNMDSAKKYLSNVKTTSKQESFT